MLLKIEKMLGWLGRFKDGLSIVGLFAAGISALVVAIWSVKTWNDQRERELMKPILEQHVKLTTSVYDLVAKMSVEKDADQLRLLSAQFQSLYSGPARQFLTPESMTMLNSVANYIYKCVDKLPHNGELDNLNCDNLISSTTGLAREARVDLSKRLITNGLQEMSEIDAFGRRASQVK